LNIQAAFLLQLLLNGCDYPERTTKHQIRTNAGFVIVMGIEPQEECGFICKTASATRTPFSK